MERCCQRRENARGHDSHAPSYSTLRRIGPPKILTCVNRQIAFSVVASASVAVNRKPFGGFIRAGNGFQSLALPVTAPNGVRRRRTFAALGKCLLAGAAADSSPASAAKTSAASLADTH